MAQKSVLLELPFLTDCDPNFTPCNFESPLPVKEFDDHLDRLSSILANLDQKSHRVRSQISELKQIQNDIKRLNNLL